MNKLTTQIKDLHTGGLTPLDAGSTDILNQVICYEIAREEIEACRPERFIHDLRVSSDNPLIFAGPGRMIISVSGYDDDPRELCDIPEFICFARKAQAYRPCWLYFCDPQSFWTLIVFNACCGTSVPGLTEEFRYSTKDLLDFVMNQFGDFNVLTDMAGISEIEAEKAHHATMNALVRRNG